MSDKNADPVLTCGIYNLDDFTLYKKATDGKTEEVLKHHCQAKADEKGNVFSYEGRIPIEDTDGGKAATGRVLACRSFDNRFWSMTLRKEKGREERTPAAAAAEEKNYVLQCRQEDSNYAPKKVPK